MGLDVYLYRYEDYADAKRRESEYEQFSEELWKQAGGYESVSDDQKEEIRTACADKKSALGLSKYGSSGERVELPDPRYPDHLFKIGYFRASYNDSSIDRLLRSRGISDLAGICGYKDDYCFQPDWEEMKANALEALRRYRLHAKNGMYTARSISPLNPFNPKANEHVNSENEAMIVFEEERKKDEELDSPHKRDEEGCRWYSNLAGHFYFGKPMEVHGMVSGFDCMGTPTFYVVTKMDDEGVAWYEHALEIVVATAEHVLAQPDPEKYYLHWSG